MQGRQEDLADKTEKAPGEELPDIEKKQLTLDDLLKKDLDLAKKILDREKAKRVHKPEFPDDPPNGDRKERGFALKKDGTPPEDDLKKKGENAGDPE